MYCKVCGKEASKDANYCPFCGAKLEEEKVEVIEPTPLEDKVEKKESHGPWNTFAKIGFILGLVGFLTSFFLAGSSLAVPAIVFSSLGLKAQNPDRKDEAKRGLRYAIGSIIVTVIIVFILIIAGIVIGLNWDKIVESFNS